MNLKVKRKVRGIESSLYLCIPKYWTDENALKKNESVEIEFLCRNELIVRVLEEQK